MADDGGVGDQPNLHQISTRYCLQVWRLSRGSGELSPADLSLFFGPLGDGRCKRWMAALPRLARAGYCRQYALIFGAPKRRQAGVAGICGQRGRSEPRQYVRMWCFFLQSWRIFHNFDAGVFVGFAPCGLVPDGVVVPTSRGIPDAVV
jgi:hypothetical protein